MGMLPPECSSCEGYAHATSSWRDLGALLGFLACACLYVRLVRAAPNARPLKASKQPLSEPVTAQCQCVTLITRQLPARLLAHTHAHLRSALASVAVTHVLEYDTALKGRLIAWPRSAHVFLIIRVVAL